MILSCQLAGVLLTGAALNDYGYFFGSWSELLGGSTSAKAAEHHHYGALITAAGPSFVDGDLRPVGDSRSGRILTVQLDGARSGLSEPALVYLPPAYFRGDRRLPVVEVLSGFPGSELNLVRRLHYPGLLLRGMHAGTTRPMVLVLLRPTVTPPRDTECTDVPGGPQALTFFASDVPAAVVSRFGLTSASFGAIGDSTGGYCAAKLALMHPDRFSAAVSLSGYFNAIRDSTTGDLWGGSAARRALNNLSWRMQHLAPPRTALLLGTSRTELGPDGYLVAQRFLRLVHAPTSADELVLPNGGHNFNTWAREIPTALAWLSSHLTR
jgi:pimeloyl-ACP methyl ester carboxylesterase